MDTQTHLNFTVSPPYFQELLDLKIVKCINEHTKLYARGRLNEQEKDKLLQEAKPNQTITFTVTEDGNSYTLFSGILDSLELDAEGEVREAVIEALGFTAQMDVKEISRSFQNQQMLYQDLFEWITKPYGGGEFDMVSNKAPIGDVIIQYQETDWQFMKRLASHFNTQLVPADGFGKLRYYIGKPELTASQPLMDHKYQIYKFLSDAAKNADNGLSSFEEKDALVYEVTSNIPIELGACVQFAGSTLYVVSIVTILNESLLQHTYKLRSDNGTMVRKSFNERIRGLSLFGNVTDIQKDQIQMLLDIDKDNSVVGNKWFSYSTVYSSPDGSGWYAMPEKTDRIRLACPDADESNSFSASAVDLEASNPDFRSEPDHKVMHTVHGKSLEFRPGQVEMRANSGTAVTMKDDGGVYINSGQDVVINAQNDINISSASGNIKVEGKEVYLISKQGGIVKLTENIVVTGKEVKVQ